MAAFVVLALAVLVASMAAVGVAVRLLWREIAGMRAAVRAAAARIQPLGEELQVELAVASTEVEALQARPPR